MEASVSAARVELWLGKAAVISVFVLDIFIYIYIEQARFHSTPC